MTIRHLLPLLLVLFQSGLAAARAHHPCESRSAEAPHFHSSALLDHVLHEESDHEDEGDREDDHDADAVDLSGVMVLTLPSLVGADSFALAPLDSVQTADLFTNAPPTPLGLPPSTAGPSAPRYITFCTLTI